MAEFTNQTVHSVYVNGQQIMTVADTTANQDVVEAGYVFYDKSGNKVTGQGNRRIFIETFKEGATSVQEILDDLKDSAIIGDMCIISKEVSEEPIPEPTTPSPAAEEPVEPEPEPQPALHNNSFFVYLMGGEVKKETDALGNSTISTPVKTDWTPITDTSLIWSTIQTILDAIGVGEGDNSIIDRLDVIEDYLGMAEDHEAIEDAIDTLKEVFDWINSPDGETALGAEERIAALESSIGTEKIIDAEGVVTPPTGLYADIDYLNEVLDQTIATMGIGFRENADGSGAVVQTLTDAIKDLKTWKGDNNEGAAKKLGELEATVNSNNSTIEENTDNINDLIEWKNTTFYSDRNNTNIYATGISSAINQNIGNVLNAISYANTICNYAFNIPIGSNLNNSGLYPTEPLLISVTKLNALYSTLNDQVSALEKQLGYAIFEPKNRYMDRVLSHGIHSVYDIQGDSSKQTWSEDYPYKYCYYEPFYLPDNWGITIEGLSFEATTPKTTEFGIASYDGVSSYIDHQPLIKKSEQNNEYFELNLNTSGRYVIYAYCEDGYAQGGASSPTPPTETELSKAKVNIKYYIQ